MTRRRITLRVNLEHGAIPIEVAMANAGFHRPDANEEFLCGLLPVDGVDRYHEARTPVELEELANGTFDLNAMPAGSKWIEVPVVFRCTYQPAESPCPSKPTKTVKSSASC